jgi:hypothetical protein
MATCAIDCDGSIRVKACGGLGPYTWSKTGNISLSATTGTAITVTSTVSGGSPPAPGTFARLRPDLAAIWSNCSGCSGALVHSLLSIDKAYRKFDCDGNDLGSANASITVELSTSTRANSCLGPVTGSPEGMDTIDCCTDPPDSVIVTANYVAGPVSDSTTVTIPWHTGSVDADCASNPVQATIVADGYIDILAGGCGCTQGTTTLTCTDATGTQSTTILHA